MHSILRRSELAHSQNRKKTLGAEIHITEYKTLN